MINPILTFLYCKQYYIHNITFFIGRPKTCFIFAIAARNQLGLLKWLVKQSFSSFILQDSSSVSLVKPSFVVSSPDVNSNKHRILVISVH